MKTILIGGILLILLAVIMFIKQYIKALKDPDVIEANKLGMLITHYRKYKKADEEIQALYKKYGTDNSQVNKEVLKIIDSLPNKNEWRRYEDYKFQQSLDNMYKEAEDLFNGSTKG